MTAQAVMPPERTDEAQERVAVRCSALFGDPRKPVNGDAVKILRRARPHEIKSEWTKEDMEAIRWAGAISKCPSCGDRAYEHGYCFGCGKPLAGRDGDRPSSPTAADGNSGAERNDGKI